MLAFPRGRVDAAEPCRPGWHEQTRPTFRPTCPATSPCNTFAAVEARSDINGAWCWDGGRLAIYR